MAQKPHMFGGVTGVIMDEAEQRYYAAQHIISQKNLFWNIEFFLNRFGVSQTARLCRVTVDKDVPDARGIIRQEKISIQSPGHNFEIILRNLTFRLVAEGDYWVGELDLTHDGLTVFRGCVLKERENLTARYVPPYRLRSDILKLDAYDWIDWFDELVKRMMLLERDKDNVRTLMAIKSQAEAIDLSKYPLDTAFTPVVDVPEAEEEPASSISPSSEEAHANSKPEEDALDDSLEADGLDNKPGEDKGEDHPEVLDAVDEIGAVEDVGEGDTAKANDAA